MNLKNNINQASFASFQTLMNNEDPATTAKWLAKTNYKHQKEIGG
jgi:hypothetical protein